MESGSTIAVRQGVINRIQLKETVIILTLSVLIPFLIHFLPDFNGIAIGAILLPMFWAPYIAIKYFKFHVGLIAGLAAPMVNSLITGNPHMGIIPLITLQLVFFVIAAGFLDRINVLKNFNAIIAYAASIIISLLVIMIFPYLMQNLVPSNYLFVAFISGLPGIVLLAVINYVSLKLKKE